MLEFGFTIPLLIDESGMVIAGHGRLQAAKQLASQGHKQFSSVPVMVAAGWSDAQRRAYTIADNRLGETSSWDVDLLRLEIGDLRTLDFDISTIGYNSGALDELFAVDNTIPPEQFPAYGDEIETSYCCPKCSYRWSGKPDAGKTDL